MFIPIINVQGSRLDRSRKSSYITLSNNGQTASVFRAYGSVVGTVGYSSGVYQWRINITELEHAGRIAIGVTTLPLNRTNNNHNYPSYGTMYGWLSDQRSAGLAASQTRGPARISRWQTGDTLLLTLNCDQRQLQLSISRTAERKTITMMPGGAGEQLYLYIFLNASSQRQQIDILD